MSSLRIIAVTLSVTILFVSRAIWVESAAPAAMPHMIYESGTTAVSEPFGTDESFVDYQGARRMDRFGNEVETAVGDYRIDPRGDVYERHSPKTALPRLASPGA